MQVFGFVERVGGVETTQAGLLACLDSLQPDTRERVEGRGLTENDGAGPAEDRDRARASDVRRGRGTKSLVGDQRGGRRILRRL